MTKNKIIFCNFLDFEQYDSKDVNKPNKSREIIKLPANVILSELSLIALKNNAVNDFIQKSLDPEDVKILNYIYKSELIISEDKYYFYVDYNKMLNDFSSKSYHLTIPQLYSHLIKLTLSHIHLYFEENNILTENNSFYLKLLNINFVLFQPSAEIPISREILEVLIYNQSELSKLPLEKQIEITSNEQIRFKIEEAQESIEFLNTLVAESNI